MSGKTEPTFEVNGQGFVVVPVEEYDRMVEQIDWLTCLEAAGVDNWSGYDYAVELKYEGLVID